jgi:hypothetical protein
VRRYHYRNPATLKIEGPWPLSVYANYVANGALSAASAATMLLWRKHAPETDGVPLCVLLDAAERAGAAPAGR